MNLSILPKNLPKPLDDGASKHLLGKILPDISLPNQDNRTLSLNRKDTFRVVIYCYPMTGNPRKPLPSNWNNIPGARGCTPQTCSFRDSYDELLRQNAVPVGITTQSVEEIKEMTTRLLVPYDVLSDQHLMLVNSLKLPTFEIDDRVFIKRLTLIVEKSLIKHVFYPVFPPDLHVNEVIEWLKKN